MTYRKTRIMGILNVTPDSFSDGGRFDQVNAAVEHARQLIAEGADILDIGAESTRPGHVRVDPQVQIQRLMPALKAILKDCPIPVSVDTSRAAVARAAAEAGAKMINDVWGAQFDPEIAEVAAAFGTEFVLMHNRETVDPAIDIMDDVIRFLERSLQIARTAGVKEEKIILDPGMGFGKTHQQSLTVIQRLDRLRAMGFPVLIGVSRKRSIGSLTEKPVEQRLPGTLAMNIWAMIDGVDIIRVHDVGPHVDARAVVEALATGIEPGA